VAPLATGPQVLAPLNVEGITDAVAIGVGAAHSCALLATGELVCWGSNNLGQLGNGTFDEADSPQVVAL
jgi:alpha-tubulin suppressor-like RCC1 family protein